MVAEPSEPRGDITGGYTPRRVRWLLRHYHDLAAGARSPRDPRLPPRRGTVRDPEKLPVEIKADLDRALSWLAQLDQDPVAANLIWALYCDPATRREPWIVRLCAVAADHGMTERTVYRHVARATRALAAYLSGTCQPELPSCQ